MNGPDASRPESLLRRSYARGTVDTDIPGWTLRCVQTSSGALDGGTRELHTPGLQLLEEHYRHVVTNHYGVAPAGSIGFVMPMKLACPGVFNGRRWTATQVCVWSTDLEFNAMSPPGDLLVAIVDRELLAEHIRQTEQLDLMPALQRDSLVFEAPLDQVAPRLARLIAAGFDGRWNLATPAAQQALRQEVLETLAPLVVEHLAGRHDTRSRSSHLGNVRRARDVALSQPHTPLQVQDLCQALRLSRRTLQESFRAVLGVSPLAYLRALRLNGARRDLLAGSGVREVTEAWGFWHWSRFSHDYRRQFGELPSQTLRRVRQAPDMPEILGGPPP